MKRCQELWEGNTEDARLEVPELVAPLRYNSEGILEERDDDEEAANGGEVGPEGLRIDLDGVFDLLCKRPKLLEWVVRVGGPVARRRAGIGEAVWVRVVAGGDGAGDVDAVSGH